MEAKVATSLPGPPGWAYEPKWDGFRVLAWGPAEPPGAVAGGVGGPAAATAGPPTVRLDSRNGKPLLRYFPELAPALATLPPGTVVDGEVVVLRGERLDFDALQNRIHPAESRVRMLAAETPASLVAFDLLALRGEDLRGRPFAERRQRLAGLLATLAAPWHLTPSTEDVEVARRWFDEFESVGCDGIVAKALAKPYIEGKREMIKVKHRRTVDAVVGGYRLHVAGDRVGSILLGLYNPQGELHFIGHCSSFSDAEAVQLLAALRTIETGDEGAFGEHARRPGGESRWTGDKDLSWVPVHPQLVVEISYDQLTGDRFRHATRFERWRTDKDPEDCTFDQLERPEGMDFAAAMLGPEPPPSSRN
jgi:ATP-dependent DNA ligase